MGNPFGALQSRWHVGPTIPSTNAIQDDLAVNANPAVGTDNGIPFRQDDHGNAPSSATSIEPVGDLDPFAQIGGIIENTADVDFFSFDPHGEPFKIALTRSIPISNLSPVLKLWSPQGVLLQTAPFSRSKLQTVYEDAPASGRYYLAVRSDGAYGSLGRYTFFDATEVIDSIGGGPIDRIELPPPSIPLPSPLGDFNTDNVVDRFDLDRWRAAFGNLLALLANGDADADGDVDGADFLAWQTNVNAQSSGNGELALLPGSTSEQRARDVAHMDPNLFWTAFRWPSADGPLDERNRLKAAALASSTRREPGQFHCRGRRRPRICRLPQGTFERDCRTWTSSRRRRGRDDLLGQRR
jgi:hypothetical protein